MKSLFYIALVFAFGSAAAAGNTIPTSVIADAKRPAVAIICNGATGIAGTGFLIGSDGYFVTASHVVRKLATISTNTGCQPMIEIERGGWGSQKGPRIILEVFPFDVAKCATNATVDAAACLTTSNPFFDEYTKSYVRSVVFDRDDAQLADGTDAIFIGFPFNHQPPITMRGWIAAYDYDLPTNEPEIIIGVNCWPGSSGSPVFTDGKIVGMVVGTRANEPGLCYARPAREIIQFLHAQNIDIK